MNGTALRQILLSSCHFVLCALCLLLASGCGDQPSPNAPLDEVGIRFTSADVMPAAKLQDRVDRVLKFTEERYMRPESQAAWQIMHGILAYKTELLIYNEKGELVPAVDWLVKGGNLRGWTVRHGDRGLSAVVESGTKAGQGHKDQWLAVLAQCQLPADQKIVVGNRTYTMQDMVEQAQWECFDGMEASWTVIGLSHYLPLDAEWKARDGNTWNFERLIQMEARQDLAMSACGGTHRLIGMTMLLNRHKNRHPNQPLSGGWKEADERIRWAVRRAKELQQPNGAFSTSYFSRAGSSPDAHLIIGTTGHTLEFLTFALTDEQLRQPWVTKAVEKLCEVFEQTKDVDVECGALYHAAHGLRLYRERRFGKPQAQVADQADETAASAAAVSEAAPPKPSRN